MLKKKVSIIIPTYKDWARLALCLESLSAQTYDSKLYEIIVVNNCMADAVPASYLIPKNCRVIVEETPGLYVARNTGIRIARGEIIGFTDSDCIPDINWINNAVLAFESDPKCYRIAGQIRLYYKSHKLTNAELYERVYPFKQDMFLEQGGIGVTANMFTYKIVFDKIGLFREDLLSGSDYEWALRAATANFAIKYSDVVIVNHPARHHLKELIKKARRIGGGQSGLDKPEDNKFQFILHSLLDLCPPLRSIPVIIKKGRGFHLLPIVLVFYIRYYYLLLRYTKSRVGLSKSIDSE
jgi:glycosyltransferase involved in cell wall biosynthesis